MDATYHYVVNEYGYLIKVQGQPAPENLPCPFCGTKENNYIEIDTWSLPDGWRIICIACLKCQAKAAPVRYNPPEISPEDARKRAYAYWNRRPNP